MRERSNRVEDVLVRFWRGMRWVRMFLLLVDERKREGGKMREKVKRRGGKGNKIKRIWKGGRERGFEQWTILVGLGCASVGLEILHSFPLDQKP